MTGRSRLLRRSSLITQDVVREGERHKGWTGLSPLFLLPEIGSTPTTDQVTFARGSRFAYAIHARGEEVKLNSFRKTPDLQLGLSAITNVLE